MAHYLGKYVGGAEVLLASCQVLAGVLEPKTARGLASPPGSGTSLLSGGPFLLVTLIFCADNFPLRAGPLSSSSTFPDFLATLYRQFEMSSQPSHYQELLTERL